MAKHIYISSVFGTATGDQSFTSEQSAQAMSALGASAVYADLPAANTGAAPTDGDVIYYANDHAENFSYAAVLTLNGAGSYTGAGLTHKSVDTTDISQYLPGASVRNTSAVYDTTLAFNHNIYGVSFRGGDETLVLSTVSSFKQMSDLTVSNDTGTADSAFKSISEGMYLRLVNVEIAGNGAAAYMFNVTSAIRVEWHGGKVTGTMPTSGLFRGTFGNGGATLLLEGVDLSLLTTKLIGVQSALNTDNLRLTLKNCLLNSSMPLPTAGTELLSPHHRVELYGCDDSSGNAAHRFYIADGTGRAQNNDSTYVTATGTWPDGTTKSSIEVITTALCSQLYAFSFDILGMIVDLSAAASDVITLDILVNSTALTLTDVNFAAYLLYKDGTTRVIPRWLTTAKTVGAGNIGVDPMDAGTEYTNVGGLGDSDWTKSIADVDAVQYRLKMDTSGVAGADDVVGVRIEVYEPSIAAGDLFINTELGAE